MKNLSYDMISPMNINFVQYTLDFFLDCCRRNELCYIELWGGAPHVAIDLIDYDGVEAIKRSIRRRSLQVSCFTPETCAYPINIVSCDRVTRERSVAYEMRGLEITEQLEAPVMQIVCGTGLFDENPLESWKWSRDSLFRIASEAKRRGILLAMEPLSPYESNLADTITKARQLIDEVGMDNLGVNIDNVPLGMTRTPMKLCFDTFLDSIYHFHICDSDLEYRHWIPCGDGCLPIEDELKVIDSYHYQGTLGLEICGAAYYSRPDEALSRALQNLRSILEKNV